MTIRRRFNLQALGLALALGSAAPAIYAHDDDDDEAGFRAGKVVTSSNATAGNELLVYDSERKGALILATRIATQGIGSGGGLGNQGAVTLFDDRRHLFVVNAGSNTVSTLRVRRGGAIEAPQVTASSGMTPFGFAVDRRGTVLVSEAFGGAVGASALSPYAFGHYGVQPQLISASVGSGQSAACWVVVTPNGRFAYTTNTASGNISAYAVERNGRAALAQAIAATTEAGPIDAAITPRGRSLFVLNGGGRSIQSFGIRRDGQLQAQGRIDGLPVGANGLAAT